MVMKKLWKVTVNAWGWDAPRTYYAESRQEATKIRKMFPAADMIEYAGMFREEKAAELTEAGKELLSSLDVIE